MLVTPHIAEVVMSDIFATANSLKSYARQHLLPHVATIVPERLSCAQIRGRQCSKIKRSLTRAPRSNPLSACCPVGASLSATSCLGAFGRRPPESEERLVIAGVQK